MRQLILVRHGPTKKDPRIASKEWRLTLDGKLRCREFADRLAAFRPLCIYSSLEAKAVESASIIAKELDLTFRIVEGLQEHEGRNAYFGDQRQFEKKIEALFARPEHLVFGSETAELAYQRFAGALDKIIERSPDGDLVVVSHGTVISLQVAAMTEVAPFDFWKRLQMPSAVVLPLADNHERPLTAQEMRAAMRLLQ